MTNQEILEKAIQKAIDGGWDVFGWSNNPFFQPIYSSMSATKGSDGAEWKSSSSFSFRYVTTDEHGNPHKSIRHVWVNEIIFNHDFAKALWPTLEGWPPMDWESHLQQMVIAEDPIAYLGENL